MNSATVRNTIALDIARSLYDKLAELSNVPKRVLPPRALVVDDDHNYCMLLQERLAQKGYSVELAANGTQALKKVEMARAFSVVLLDLSFPVGPQGVEILEGIRSICPPVHIILVSGYVSEETKRYAAQIGCSVVDKLAPAGEFERAIDEAVKSSIP